MNKHLLILAVALVTSATAAICWLLTLSSPLPAEFEIRASERAAGKADVSPAHTAKAVANQSRMTRTADPDFPKAMSVIASAPLPNTSEISARFAPDAQSSATLPRRDAVNGLGLQPAERVRNLPAEAVNETRSTPAEAADTPLILVVDRSLHDPAAWVENKTPVSESQTAVKARIADEFAADVATAVKNPAKSAENIETAWRNAKAEADAQFRKMFGDAAFNRAGVSAGRAAVSGR